MAGASVSTSTTEVLVVYVDVEEAALTAVLNSVESVLMLLLTLVAPAAPMLSMVYANSML